MRARLTLALLLMLLARSAVADPPPATPPGVLLLDGLDTPGEDLARLAELAGAAPTTSQLIRRGGFQVRPVGPEASSFAWAGRLVVDAPTDGWSVLPARLEAVWNSRYPSGGNDGLLWAGRGLSTQARVGVAGRWGVVSAALAPEVAWQQNGWFETVPTGQGGALAFQNPWYGDALDVPQRFGAGPFATAGLGQSYLRVDVWGVAAGLSSENLWLGPGIHNAILLTNNAPGFPHAFLGTSRPVETWIGALEAQLLWGQLERSPYLSTPGHPLYSALAVTWQPRWVPGLYLGGARSYVQSPAMFRMRRGLAVLVGWPGGILPRGNYPDDNHEVSGWFRWVMPEAGFELYGEWGRDDASPSLGALVRDPEWTQGWVWGFQKLLRAGDRVVRVGVEATRLHNYRPNADFSWYVHGYGVDYTNAGQLLGAAAGPGGDSQRLTVDVLTSSGRIGGFIERTARNDQVYWTVIDPQGTNGGPHDAELAAGYRQVLFVGRAEVSLEVSAAHRWSRDFLQDETNLRGAVQVAWPSARPDPVRSW